MGEVAREVKSYEIRMYCDYCGEEMLRSKDDIVLATYPPQYPHFCKKCKNVQNYPFTYPRLVYSYADKEK